MAKKPPREETLDEFIDTLESAKSLTAGEGTLPVIGRCILFLARCIRQTNRDLESIREANNLYSGK